MPLIGNAIEVDPDVAVAVRAGLLVKPANRVPDLVDDHAFLHNGK
jgi:hypothetical protein